MSLFRSAAELSSSDSDSISESEDSQVRESGSSTPHNATKSHSGSPKGKAKQLPKDSDSTDLDSSVSFDDASSLPQELVDPNIDQHANLMTAALLEFYCQSRAADILNAQRGSNKPLSRHSPEARYLGKKLYKFKSKFLSTHGILPDGIDREEMGPSRQSYRDNLDLLGISALEDMDFHDTHKRSPKIGAGEDLALMTKSWVKRSVEDIETPALLRRNTDPSASFRKQLPPAHEVDYIPGVPRRPMNLPNPSIPLFGSSPVGVPLFNSPAVPPYNHLSRYSVEFQELKVLGRGSFGEVYHVTNHIDGQDYAVKKIPLSQRRLEQLQFGGQNQLETIMKEIRTLARLEHTNIVRYYGAWVEQAHHSHTPPVEYHDGHPSHDEQLHDSLPSPDTPNESSMGIVFGHSESSNPGSQASSPFDDKSFAESINRRNSRATNSSHQSKKGSRRGLEEEEDDVESIPRHFDGSASAGQTSSFGETDDIFTDGLSQDRSKLQVQTRYRPGQQPPAVILHIQMSLHPISLASYLKPESAPRYGQSSTIRRHCFHLLPSLKLMLDIVSGVEYLHSKGIVHRDLKPANIFLCAPENPTADVCTACSSDQASPVQFCRPRIGDFGLVADISHINEPSQGTVTPYREGPAIQRVVGTEFYRPPANISWAQNGPGSSVDRYEYKIDEKLDVYALGVILFETLYRLNTKMERQFVLNDLTRGSNHDPSEPTIFPADFAAKIDLGSVKLDGGNSVADSLMKCMKGMLEPNSHQRWTCQKVKEHLRAMKKAIRRYEEASK